MSGYRVELTRRAQKQLASVDRKTAQLIAAYIDQNLDGSVDPRLAPGAKKLQGINNGWRWRVGSYRILGTVNKGRVLIEVFRIGHRREAYRNL